MKSRAARTGDGFLNSLGIPHHASSAFVVFHTVATALLQLGSVRCG
jgi:hypothetical protein